MWRLAAMNSPRPTLKMNMTSRAALAIGTKVAAKTTLTMTMAILHGKILSALACVTI